MFRKNLFDLFNWRIAQSQKNKRKVTGNRLGRSLSINSRNKAGRTEWIEWTHERINDGSNSKGEHISLQTETLLLLVFVRWNFNWRNLRRLRGGSVTTCSPKSAGKKKTVFLFCWWKTTFPEVGFESSYFYSIPSGPQLSALWRNKKGKPTKQSSFNKKYT